MENIKHSKPRIRAVPQENSRLLTIAAVLLVFTGILPFFRQLAFFLPLSFLLPIMPPPLPCAFIAATGVLLFFSGRHRGVYFAALIALPIAMNLFYARLEADLFPILASFLILLSAIGWRFNVVFGFLPRKFSLPLMSLASAALTLFCIPSVARAMDRYIAVTSLSPLKSYCVALAALLPFVCLLLVNLAMKPQNIEKADAPPRRVRSVPRGGVLFVIAAYILLAGGIANLIITLTSAYNVNALILSLPLLAAGILIVMSKGSEKRYLAGAVCLTLTVALSFFNLMYFRGSGFWTYSIPILLMLVSAIGVLHNVSPRFLSKLTRSPILNIPAAVLLITYIVTTAVSTVENNASAARAREDAVTRAATAAGSAVALAAYEEKSAEDAAAVLSEAVAAYETVLEAAKEYVSEKSVATVASEIDEAVAGAALSKDSAEATAVTLGRFSLAFAASLNKVSAEAASIYDETANAPPKALPGAPATSAAAPAPETPAPAPEAPVIDRRNAVAVLNAAVNDVFDAAKAAERTAKNAASSAEKAIAAITDAEEKIAAAVIAADEATILLHMLIISLLPSAGLVLLNLSLESRVLESRGALAAFFAFCRRIVRWFYRDVGGKLQMLAKIQGVICVILACLSALTAAAGLCGFIVNYFFTGSGVDYLIVLGIGVGGILSSFIIALPTWLLSAFGQITSDLREVKSSGIAADNTQTNRNPDDLPEI